MAYQLSTLITKVRNRLRDTGYSTSEITDYINDAQNDVCNEYQLPFMQTSHDYTVTAGTSDITAGSGLPTDYVQAIDLIDTTNGNEQVIPYRNVTILDESFPDLDDSAINPANIPQFWYKYADTIRLYPAPAGAYTLTLRYWKKPTPLAGDAAVPEIPSEFAELLVEGATYRVLQVKGNYDQAAIHQNKYDELLQKLVVRYTQVQTGAPMTMPVNVLTRGGNF